MDFMKRIREKTVGDVMDTAKEKIDDAVKTAAKDRVNTILTLLPLAATALLIFGGKSHEEERRMPRIPTKTVINNYYYGEGGKPNVPDNH